MEILKKYGIADAGKDYTWFDFESFEESDSYIESISNLATVSKNKFAPQNLTVAREGWTETDQLILEKPLNLNSLKIV